MRYPQFRGLTAFVGTFSKFVTGDDELLLRCRMASLFSFATCTFCWGVVRPFLPFLSQLQRVLT